MAAASDRVFKLLVLPGDGIGPEIIRETLRVVDWARNAGLRIELSEGLAGGASIDIVDTIAADVASFADSARMIAEIAATLRDEACASSKD